MSGRRRSDASPERPAGPALLEMVEVGVRFGGVHAVESATLTVSAGQICALIGPNGAGKTTLFNTVSGLVPVTSGTIGFLGTDVLALRPHEVVRRGIGRTFQNLALCESLSVEENVLMGAYSHGTIGFWRAALGWRIGAEETSLRRRARQALDAVEISHLAAARISDLPYGTLKRVEMARALAAQPQLLLLDEPAGGLPHGEVDQLGELIVRLRDDLGVTVLLVEHHMALVMSIADHVSALVSGRIVAQGSPAEVRNDPQVQTAYLGVAA